MFLLLRPWECQRVFRSLCEVWVVVNFVDATPIAVFCRYHVWVKTYTYGHPALGKEPTAS